MTPLPPSRPELANLIAKELASVITLVTEMLEVAKLSSSHHYADILHDLGNARIALATHRPSMMRQYIAILKPHRLFLFKMLKNKLPQVVDPTLLSE